MNEFQLWWYTLNVAQQFLFIIIGMICTASFLMGVGNFIKDILRIIFRRNK